MKKIVALFLLLVMVFPSVSLAESVDPENQYTVWLRVGADKSFFPDYSQNPGVLYLKTLPLGPEGKHVDFSFFVPVSGSETDNFNTLIGTEEYMDLMDLSAFTGTAIELYEDEVALDITEYVEQYMPNYMAFLDAHPDLKATSTNLIDGEPRMIQIRKYEDDVNFMWGGYIYRRDWILKYGTNPVDGSAFSGEFTDPDDVYSWVDNIVFPSGEVYPKFISDWEWMFEIFTRAMEDLGIKDGYCTTLYYPGYLETGDIMTGFGGGNPLWYLDDDRNIQFGATSDNFRAYLQCMNTWYKKGWLDKSFNERTSDMFYEINMAGIYSGKVGMWYGYPSTLGGNLNNPDDPYLAGFVGAAAPQPINDVYGSNAQKGHEPDAMYQINQEGVAYIVTPSILDKDIPTFFAALDYFYSEEGALMMGFGLNKEQFEATQSELYIRYGITDGAYQLIPNEEGVLCAANYPQVKDGEINGAIRPERMPGLNAVSRRDYSLEDQYLLEHRTYWTMYKNTGWLPESFTGQMDVDDATDAAKVQTRVKEFMTKNVPTFIKGSRDPYSDSDWDAYVNALNKYKPEKVTDIYQDLADRLYGE